MRRDALLAMVDQTIFSLTPFLLQVLCARSMSAEAFGIFIAFYGSLGLFLAIQNCLIADPLAFFGNQGSPADNERCIKSSVDLNTIAHVVPSVAIATALLINLITGGELNGGALTSIAYIVTAPILGHLLLLRRIDYVRRDVFSSTRRSITFALTLGVAAFIAYCIEELTAPVAFACIALSAGGAAMIKRHPPQTIEEVEVPESSIQKRQRLKAAAGHHWRYGRWLLPGAFLGWFLQNGVFMAYAVIESPAASGIVKAVLNLFLPISLLIGSMVMLIQPRLNQLGHDAGTRWAVKAAVKPVVVMSVFSALFCALIAAFGPIIAQFVYGRTYATPLFWLCAMTTQVAVFMTFNIIAAKILARVKIITIGYFIAAFATFTAWYFSPMMSADARLAVLLLVANVVALISQLLLVLMSVRKARQSDNVRPAVSASMGISK